MNTAKRLVVIAHYTAQVSEDEWQSFTVVKICDDQTTVQSAFDGIKAQFNSKSTQPDRFEIVEECAVEKSQPPTVCPWCFPEAPADLYYLCEKHAAELKSDVAKLANDGGGSK